MIKAESYVHRFGVKVVLNSVEPDNIRKVDKLTMEEMPVRSQIQASKATDISSFSIDAYTDYMRGIVGAPATEELGNIIAGKDEFKFSLNLDIKDLEDKCKMILKRFRSNKYKENYDWYDHLKAIEDPEIIGELEIDLMEKVRDRESESIYLSPPEIIDWIDVEFSYTEKSERYSDLDIKDFYNYLEQINYSFDIEKLKQRKVYIHSDNEEDETWKVYNLSLIHI